MADVDNDGDLDIYAATDHDSDRLYLNNGLGRFMNMTRLCGLYSLVDSYGCVFADFNDDGNLDLFVAAMTGNKKSSTWSEDRFYRGTGDGYFTEVTEGSGVSNAGSSGAVSVADVDNDGKLDMIVASFNEGNCRLYINKGDLVFSETKKKVRLKDELVFSEEAEKRGLLTGKAHFSGSNVADMDNDGHPDVLLPKLLGEDKPGIRYYHNNGDGTFTEMTERAGLSTTDNACSLAVGDYDNDGDLDFLANLFNHLYRNNGDNTFTDVSEEAGLGEIEKRHSRGCSFVDADNDGDLDLFITGIPPQFFCNNGNGTFTDVSKKWGVVVERIHGCAFGDMDGDGDMDMYGTNWQGKEPWKDRGKFVFYRNTANNKAYLKVRMARFLSNRFGVGAKLELYRQGHLGEKRYLMGYREVTCGEGTFTCNPLEQHFGLGKQNHCDLRVTFPVSGKVIDLKGVKCGQTILVKELPEGNHRTKIRPDGSRFR